MDITIHFSRFEPDHVDVAPRETVRFVVHNTDPIDHEFILGDQYVQTIHENGTELRHPPKPGEMSVPAGTTQVTTYTFPATNGQLIFACHLPGHYAFGTVGRATGRIGGSPHPPPPVGPTPGLDRTTNVTDDDGTRR